MISVLSLLCLTLNYSISAQAASQCQVTFSNDTLMAANINSKHYGPPRGPLKLIRLTGRSQPGGIFQDEAGTKWYLKRDTYFAELQTSAEVISSWVYRHFGYQTPETYIVETAGSRYSASLLEAESTPFDFGNLPDTSHFRAMRVVSALLRDWDRTISGNNLKRRDGSILLLDFGGSLGARAKGRHKPGRVFSPAVGAYSHSHDPLNSYEEYSVESLSPEHPWQTLQRDDFRLAMRGLRSLDYDIVREIVAKAKYSKVSDQVEMTKSLFERRTQMMRFLEAKLRSIPILGSNDHLAIHQVISSVKDAEGGALRPIGAVEVDFMRDSEIVLFFHPKDATSIAEKGFVNQHVSRKSSGAFDPALRLDIEDAIAGLPLDQISNEAFRPKSALIIGTGSLANVVTRYSASGGYGGIGAVMKHEVKTSSLWTYGDSLQVGQEIFYGRVSQQDVAKVRGTFERRWMSPKTELPPTRRNPEFVEALIFGDLTFNDVDHFIVEYESSAAPILNSGKPVFLVTRGQTAEIPFIYRQILNFGETIPMNLPAAQKDKILDSLSRKQGKVKNPKISSRTVNAERLEFIAA
ncbi:MAG: hypothetical protein EOP06_03485 [Proteobacteria bacterium]|nr:MAG: hypothetical protein EOP06_03485 [Pseudomonadota bacterium]